MGGILDGGEGGVCLEEVREDLCALHLQLVGAQTANKGQIQVSMAADSRNPGKWCLLERLEGLVRLERLGQCLRALGINAVAGEAASESRPQVSGAADTCVLVMCGQEGRLVAYSSVWSVEFALRPSERCLAAAALRSLSWRLQTRVKMACQRPLTPRFGPCSQPLQQQTERGGRRVSLRGPQGEHGPQGAQVRRRARFPYCQQPLTLPLKSSPRRRHPPGVHSPSHSLRSPHAVHVLRPEQCQIQQSRCERQVHAHRGGGQMSGHIIIDPQFALAA